MVARPAGPIDVYDNLYKEFNPVKFNAKEYVSLAKEAGMKYIMLVSKHHDGFSMYATKLSDYNIMNTPLHRDVARELADECRKQGIRFCTYYSIIDWHHPDYLPRGSGDKRPPKDANFDNYLAFMKGQLREIVENYHPAVMWFDGEWEDHGRSSEGGNSTRCSASLIRRSSSTTAWARVARALHTSAWPRRKRPSATSARPSRKPAVSSGIRNLYWESNMTLCQQWAWKPNDKVKTLKECIDLLVRNAGFDGNFLFNVGPMPNGEIEPRQVERLQEIGRWTKQYGESIYGTRGGPFRPARWGVSTCQGERIFIHVLHFPFDGPGEPARPAQKDHGQPALERRPIGGHSDRRGHFDCHPRGGPARAGYGGRVDARRFGAGHPAFHRVSVAKAGRWRKTALLLQPRGTLQRPVGVAKLRRRRGQSHFR